MWCIVVAVLLVVAAAAEGQSRVIYERTAQDDEVIVMAGQPQVVVQAGPLPLAGSREVKKLFNVVQVVVTPQERPQGHRLFQFLVPPMQQQVLLPSPQLPASCGPFIVSLVSMKLL